MALQSTRRMRIAVDRRRRGGCHCRRNRRRYCGGVRVRLEHADGGALESRKFGTCAAARSAQASAPSRRDGDLGARERDPDQGLRWVHPHDQDEQQDGVSGRPVC